IEEKEKEVEQKLDEAKDEVVKWVQSVTGPIARILPKSWEEAVDDVKKAIQQGFGVEGEDGELVVKPEKDEESWLGDSCTFSRTFSLESPKKHLGNWGEAQLKGEIKVAGKFTSDKGKVSLKFGFEDSLKGSLGLDIGEWDWGFAKPELKVSGSLTKCAFSISFPVKD